MTTTFALEPRRARTTTHQYNTDTVGGTSTSGSVAREWVASGGAILRPIVNDPIGDIVNVEQFRRTSKRVGRLGTEVKGGVRAVTVHEDAGTCDVNFYLEGRRASGAICASRRICDRRKCSGSPCMATAVASGTSGSSNSAAGTTAVVAAATTMTTTTSTTTTTTTTTSGPATNKSNSVANGESAAKNCAVFPGTDALEATAPPPSKRSASKRERKQHVPWQPSEERQLARSNANQRYSNHLPALGEGEDTGVGSGPPVSVADLPVLARNNKAFKQWKWRKEPRHAKIRAAPSVPNGAPRKQ